MLAAVVLAGTLAPPSPARADGAVTLSAALEAGRTANPTLVAARLRAAVDTAAIDQARERPNPELRFEAERDTPRQSLTLAQPLELGKRGRRIDLARAAARSGEAEIARVEAETQLAVRRAFYALADAQRRAGLAGELRAIAERAHVAAQARFEGGDAPRLEVLQAELALEDALNEEATLAGELAAARAQLNASLGRPAAAAVTAEDDLDGMDVPEAGEDLEGRIASNTAVVAASRAVEEAEARAALARAQQVPDPTIEGAVTRDAEPDFQYGWRAALAVSVPLFTRHGAAVRIEDATAAQRRAEREASLQQVRAAVVGARAQLDARRQQYARYRDAVLPRAREVEEMAQDSYRSGQTGLPTLLQSLQATRDVRRRAVAAAADYESARADLEQALRLAPEPAGTKR